MERTTHILNAGSPAVRDAPRCPACGAIGYRDDSYCPCCGSRMTTVCERCGAINQHPVANYCSRCGARLNVMRESGRDE
jgi:hypothetical protein